MRSFRLPAVLAGVALAVLALAGPASAARCANATTLPGQASERVLAKATVAF